MTLDSPAFFTKQKGDMEIPISLVHLKKKKSGHMKAGTRWNWNNHTHQKQINMGKNPQTRHGGTYL